MATLMYKPPANPYVNVEMEPDDQWKLYLRHEITRNLHSMVDEAKKHMQDRLAQAVVSEEERESISKEHHETMNYIRKLAESQFQAALQRERLERRWVAGEQVDATWSNEMVKEQQAILDKIERDRKMEEEQQAVRDRKAKEREQAELELPAQPPRTESPKTLTTDRKSDGLLTPKGTKETGREGSYFADWIDQEGEHLYGAGRPDQTKSRTGSLSGGGLGVGSYRAPSILHTPGENILDRPKMSPFVYQKQDTTRSPPPPPVMSESIRTGNLRHKASISSSSIRSTPSVPEIWSPTLTPEQGAATSGMRRGNLRRKTSISSSINSSIYSTPSGPNIWKPSITPAQDAAMSDSTRRGSLRSKPSISSSINSNIRPTPSVPEIWKPTITPEQDAAVPDGRWRGSLRRKTSISSSINSSIHSTPSIPNTWKPNITPEQDAAMSRTFNSYHRRSTASTASTFSYQPPPVPPTVPERDKERYAIPPSVSSNSVPITSSAYPRPVDNPRSFQPPTSASRPGITRNTSIDEGGRIPQQNSRSQNKSQFQGYSQSNRTPDDIPRSWLSSYVPGRLQSKDIRPAYARQQGPIHTYREEPESESEDELSE